MRRAARVDRNQPEIVKVARAAGASVQMLHTIGKGCPDLLVGLCGVNEVWELKDGDQPPSKRKLTPDEELWHQQWRGTVVVIENKHQALERLDVIRGRK